MIATPRCFSRPLRRICTSSCTSSCTLPCTFRRLIALSLACSTLVVSATVSAQSAAPGSTPASAPAASGEALVTKRLATLREEPSDTSRSLQTLPLRSPLTRLGDKQGPWIKVRLDDASQGWVHMFDVTLPEPVSAAGSTSAGVLRSVTSFFNRGNAASRSGNVATSTVGIRGLTAQDIANATPNPQALQQAESFRLDAGQASQFASAARLNRQSVAALPLLAPPAESKP